MVSTLARDAAFNSLTYSALRLKTWTYQHEHI
jgi:hypothetical protein